jgi:hypothetical protein
MESAFIGDIVKVLANCGRLPLNSIGIISKVDSDSVRVIVLGYTEDNLDNNINIHNLQLIERKHNPTQPEDLIIGRGYYLDGYNNSTGFFVKRNNELSFFRRGRGNMYLYDSDGLIPFNNTESFKEV